MKKNETLTSNSRRSFIKKSALATTGFMIIPRHVLGGPGFIAPSDRLVIAAIGVGGKGESDIRMFAESGKADIGFLCDVDDRRAAASRARFPKAKYYKDYREMMDKEGKNFDAVSVSTPDHNHAVQTMAAMERGKHVYVQKPLTHDIYEARALTEAAKKYRVVTQMGNQGASGDGVRIMKEWFNAGLIGEVHTVHCWTNRPVWPQGIPWPENEAPVPAELDWDLWLGTAPHRKYVNKLVPFNWRGWWDYGTGALGDMGCHLVEAPYSVLGLSLPKDVQCSVGSVYVDEFKRGYFPESAPPSSHVIMTFPGNKNTGGNDLTMHWMDGGIQPKRPEELGPNEIFGDGGNGVLFIGTKGKMMCGTYGENPTLLPTPKMQEVNVPRQIERVPGGANGHYAQWVEGAIAGYGNKELSSPFEIAGPLTETLLIANLAIRGQDIRNATQNEQGNTVYNYPGRDIKMLWDAENMRITNFDEANQFVKREYRKGWNL